MYHEVFVQTPALKNLRKGLKRRERKPTMRLKNEMNTQEPYLPFVIILYWNCCSGLSKVSQCEPSRDPQLYCDSLPGTQPLLLEKSGDFFQVPRINKILFCNEDGPTTPAITCPFSHNDWFWME